MDEPLDPALAAVIAAIPEWEGDEPDVTPITIGITNRNFKVDIGDGSFVVRLSGKDTDLLGIDRAAENEAASAAAAAGVAPEVFAFLPDLGALITRFVQGAHIPEEDLEREDVLGAVVRSVRAIHAGPPIPSSFPVFRIVEDYRAIAAERGVAAPPAFDQVHAKAGDIEAALSKHPLPDRPCHNDLLNANFLLDGDHVWIVDYEYGGMGDLFFDLGNLSINNGLTARRAGDVAAPLLRRRDRGASRSAAADADHVGLPRGDVGRRAAGHLHVGLRLRRLRRSSLHPLPGERLRRSVRRTGSAPPRRSPSRWPSRTAPS